MKTKTLKQKREQVLKQTITIYNSKNLNMDKKGLCVYSPTRKNVGCAVGRLIKNKKHCKILDGADDPAIDSLIGDSNYSNCIPKSVKRLGESFLSDLQILHDLKDNWNNDGLSEEGHSAAGWICDKFKLSKRAVGIV